MQWYEKTKDAVHDKDNIKGFFGEYRWLSNFEPCLVEYDGLVFQSSEAAYQAAKILENRAIFIGLSASESKKLGKRLPLRKGWDEMKTSIMEEILFNKFNKNSYLREKLLATGSKYLEETNWWNDKFWGVCNGTGENNLGKTLMKIRESLKKSINT
jgi:ribA/ribD-fused uncharacterized protein